MPEISCPHCGNEDDTLITLSGFVMTTHHHYYPPRTDTLPPDMPVADIYYCEVCSKKFTITTPAEGV